MDARLLKILVYSYRNTRLSPKSRESRRLKMVNGSTKNKGRGRGFREMGLGEVSIEYDFNTGLFPNTMITYKAT